MRSCGKNFIKFDRMDWKILAFKVEKRSIFNASLQFQMALTAICGKLLYYGF